MKCFPSFSTEKKKKRAFHQLSWGNNALLLKFENSGMETNERKTKTDLGVFQLQGQKN